MQTWAQVFTRVRGADVSFRDVTIKIPDRGCEWRHAPEAWTEILKKVRVEGSFQNRWVKGSKAPTRPTQSAMTGVCQEPALTHTLSPPRRREKKDATKMNFSSCSNHSWIINDYYIFFPYLLVWVFLFLRTSFSTAQHVGPMVHYELIIPLLFFSKDEFGLYSSWLLKRRKYKYYSVSVAALRLFQLRRVVIGS